MIQRSLVFASFVVISLLITSPSNAQLNNNCMDCLQNQIKHTRADGSIWYESDGFCCNAPCAGYEHYSMNEPDRGFGCLTQEVNNELVVGDICKSNDNDLGCENKDEALPPVTKKAGGDPTDTPCNGCSGTDSAMWTPIVVNRRSGQYDLSSLENGVSFDIDASGRRKRTAWTEEDLELVWVDRNADGVVTDASELFGSATALPQGGLAANGFEAMRDLDWNNDNRLDAIDPAWSHLRLWRDANRNGVSESGETSFISASEIESLELDYHVIGRRDSHGNRLRYKGMMTLRGNARRPYYDVLFVHE